MDLWTYRARLREVTDGDTYVLEIDQGFGNFTVKDIRLRGIDVHEKSTKEGRAAIAFVASWFDLYPYVAVTTDRIKFRKERQTFARYVGTIQGLDAREQPVNDADLATVLRINGFAKAVEHLG
jgi:hypothetical protein